MKLMQFNCQHFRHYITKEIDFEEFAKVISDTNADIVSLNEVFGSGIFGNEASIIAGMLGYYYYFGKAISISKGEYGNCILSKFPIIHPQTLTIKDALSHNEDVYYESRIIIKCQIEGINILVTHVGLALEEQKNATCLLIDLIKKTTTKLVIMGDFNMFPDNENIKSIKHYVNSVHSDDVLTFPSDNPIEKRDYIFISKDLTVINSSVIKIVISDHLPITAEIME